VLHLMGLDHEELTYRYSGRDLRLTDVHGNVTRDVISQRVPPQLQGKKVSCKKG
jgi:hypothetical protein